MINAKYELDTNAKVYRKVLGGPEYPDTYEARMVTTSMGTPFPRAMRTGAAVDQGAPKAPTPPALAWKGKAYKDMKPLERSRLAAAEPELYKKMRDNWHALGRPPREGG